MFANPMSKRFVVDVPANLDVQLNVAEVRRDEQVGCRQLLVDVLLNCSMVMFRYRLVLYGSTCPCDVGIHEEVGEDG